MKVIVRGKGDVSLTQQHFVAAGGQASVYLRQGVAYKIYTDPKDTIPEAKFKALSVITDPNVIKPEDQLLEPKNNVPIGYTMKGLTGTYGLCMLFTRTFRDDNKVTQDQIINLTCKLREHTSNIHKAGVLIVDLNEFNVLVQDTFDDAYFIDVDSYQVPGYPATVILPSVRDFSVPAKDFSPLSDWFSFAVLSFQLFVGIHPYKGTHKPSMSIDKDHRLEHRMRNRISAFRTSEVRLPGCCYPFDTIPQNFRDWLKAVLEDGMRLPPPDPRGGPAAVVHGPVAVTATPFVVTSGNLVINEIQDLEKWQLMQYVEAGGHTLALLSSGENMKVLYDGRSVFQQPWLPGQTVIGFTPKNLHPVALNVYQGKVTFHDFQRRSVEMLEMTALELNRSGDRFYLRTDTQVLEVEFAELASKTLVTASHSVAHTLQMASRLYEGCAIQSMLGSAFVSLFPRSKEGYQVKVPELDKYKIVDAKFDGGVMMVVGAKDGRYNRLVFRFDSDFQTYDLRTVEDITPAGLNFITLASGICVSLTEEEKIEAFSAKKNSQGLKIVEDQALSNTMRLLKINGKAGFERAGKLYSMSLK